MRLGKLFALKTLFFLSAGLRLCRSCLWRFERVVNALQKTEKAWIEALIEIEWSFYNCQINEANEIEMCNHPVKEKEVNSDYNHDST